MMHADDLYGYLKESFPDADIDIHPLVDDQDHYAVTIKTDDFIGKNRIQQHQMVYQSLKGHVGTTLHALSLTTATKT